mmetsp:Transcript_4949/g.11755  ORF Transcript_4949/g.11755 Transcript_4949/m.11755 type:complete len:335 (+) Transcript_4949:351-1355(+)
MASSSCGASGVFGVEAAGASSVEAAGEASAAAPSAGAAPPSADAAASWRARSSSMEMRNAIASSGSRFGSMPPNSAKPPPPPPPPPVEASPPPPPPPESLPWITGEDISTSDGTTPAGIATKFELSLAFAASTKARSLSALPSRSPSTTTSTAILFFLRSFPTFTSAFCSASTGLPTKSTILCAPFLFLLCLRANCATWTPSTKFNWPPTDALCSEFRMLPMSSVGLTSTLAPAPRPVDAMVRTPTDDSGFCCIFAPTTRLAASCWLSCRVGVKSPFLMNSLVSRHIIVLSRGMVAVRARRLVARAAAAFWSVEAFGVQRRAALAARLQSCPAQ